MARKTCILLQSASSGLRLESAATTEPPGMQSENEPFSSMHACAAAVTSSQMFVSYAPSKMRTLLISLEMENSSMHPMRAAEARDTVCGGRFDGSTRPERPEKNDKDMLLVSRRPSGRRGCAETALSNFRWVLNTD